MLHLEVLENRCLLSVDAAVQFTSLPAGSVLPGQQVSYEFEVSGNGNELIDAASIRSSGLDGMRWKESMPNRVEHAFWQGQQGVPIPTLDDVGIGGDVDGDGFSDAAIGGRGFGKVALAFGGANRTELRLDPFGDERSLSLIVEAAEDETRFGPSLDASGDYNNDGIADFAFSVGSSGGSISAYIIFGGGHLSPGLSIQSSNIVSSGLGLKIIGEAGFDNHPTVANGGDLNGDGIDDLIFGTAIWPRTNGPGFNHVIYGSDSLSGLIHTSDLSDGGGLTIVAESGRGIFAPIGDVNGDGVNDLAVTQSEQEEVLIFYGGARLDSAGVYPLSSLQADVVISPPSDNHDWVEIGSAGDFNGDGSDDIIVSRARSGVPSDQVSSFVILGDARLPNSMTIVPGQTGIYEIAPDGISVLGGFGLSASSAGDLNADGFDDVVLGASNTLGGGAFFVIFGRDVSQGISVASIHDMRPDDGFAITALQSELILGGGGSVSAGDWNGDGADDLLVGAEFVGGGIVFGATSNVISGPLELRRSIVPETRRRYRVTGTVPQGVESITLVASISLGSQIDQDVSNNLQEATVLVGNTALTGDLDGNGSIDFRDFLILGANFGTTDAIPEEGDLDGDGVVGIDDFELLRGNFGATATDLAFAAWPIKKL